MANTEFKVKVVTPKGVALEKSVSFMKLPGASGEIGVLPSHSAALADLMPGKIRIEFGDNQVERFFVPEGLTQILQDEVVILTPYIERAHDIDVQRAEASLKRAQDRLKNPKPETDAKRARLSLLRAQARLYIANVHQHSK